MAEPSKQTDTDGAIFSEGITIIHPGGHGPVNVKQRPTVIDKATGVQVAGVEVVEIEYNGGRAATRLALVLDDND